jgi:2-polyprenyl-3-methyl-5-hydroxy-6-metoxy-1,4-benzoquinol methylase
MKIKAVVDFLNFSLPESRKPFFRKTFLWILRTSIEKASKEQGLQSIAAELTRIVPNIKNQYSTFEIDNPYLNAKVRSQHAFQISLVNEIIGEFDKPTIVDIGDSAGTHLQYLLGLYSKNKKVHCLSVNLDAQAVEKIKQKGIDAIHAKAEALHKYNIDADIFLCFEMIEHLMNPCQFLHELATKTSAKYIVITVPYLRNSRVGLHHIKRGEVRDVYAENTHIFELCPKDWKLLVRHSGWNVAQERVYLQYPKRDLLFITKPLWRRFDFEGFFGMIITKDDNWSSKYMDW